MLIENTGNYCYSKQQISGVVDRRALKGFSIVSQSDVIARGGKKTIGSMFCLVAGCIQAANPGQPSSTTSPAEALRAKVYRGELGVCFAEVMQSYTVPKFAGCRHGAHSENDKMQRDALWMESKQVRQLSQQNLLALPLHLWASRLTMGSVRVGGR